MILKASQRSGGKQLATHLQRMDENDHVEVHQLRGFVSDTLEGALRKIYAISRGTKCVQYLFSLSLSPPETSSVPVSGFERAIETIEEQLGLKNQPRAIVFHEKNGRRHVHCVWSRINAATMTAIELPHFKLKLRDTSRKLYIEHGWEMPRGLMNSKERDPLNFSLQEWQQAKRAGRDPKVIKTIFQDCWAVSDGLPAFKQALAARGYYLAQGDRRGFVAIDYQGEVYSISRWIDVRPKAIAAKLGEASALPSLAEVKKELAERMSAVLRRHIDQTRSELGEARIALEEKRRVLVLAQRRERSDLRDQQAYKTMEGLKRRTQRLPRGLKALWGWVTGSYGKLAKELAAEADQERRDHEAERQALIHRQLSARKILQREVRAIRAREDREVSALNQDLNHYLTMDPEAQNQAVRPSMAPRVRRPRQRQRDMELN